MASRLASFSTRALNITFAPLNIITAGVQTAFFDWHRPMNVTYRTVLTAAVGLAVVGLGCNAAPELETWPVTGTVVDQTGASLTSGAVRFFANDETQGDPH